MNSKRPNIITILADDMGYGDMRCNNPECRIPTPNLDRLAGMGMRFTDAHAGSSVCTPSRYNLLTGRYAWRSRLKSGIVWQWDGALIEPGRETVASLLKSNGYDTVCIGKWHLGWDWPTLDGKHPNETLTYGSIEREKRDAYGRENIDFSGRLGGGPVDHGFDSYFGVDVPNFPPYAWFENSHLVAAPTEEKPDHLYGHPGPACPEWNLEAMIPEMTRRAVAYVADQGAAQRSGSTDPFYLHYPLTSPHSPIVPNKAFQGQSGIGAYGDFVCEVDWVVGEILDALEKNGILENTLVIFTSDNGPEDRTPDGEGVYERARQHRHYSMGDLRGIKRDAWEGGHRVPFIASWPEAVPSASVCHQLIGLGDLMATCADIIGTPLADGAGEDSVSALPLFRGQTDTPTRSSIIHHSISGKFAVRKDNWVLIDAPSGDDNREPEWFQKERGYREHDCPAELFNLDEDPSERTNLYRDRPEVVSELKALLENAKKHGSDGAPPEEGPVPA